MSDIRDSAVRIIQTTRRRIQKVRNLHIHLSKNLRSMNVGPCHHGMARPRVAEWRNGLQYGG